MNENPFSLSMHTVIAASPLLGHELEDRATIRSAQDPQMLDRIRCSCATPLRSGSQQDLFSVAPLDLLVSSHKSEKQFHLLELNGTGIGGLTNLTADALSPILDGLRRLATAPTSATPLILIASSGKESEQNPRLNRLLHEKLLYADAIRHGFIERGSDASVFAMPTLAADASSLDNDAPAIVVGYIKDFLAHLRVDADGTLLLLGREVTGAVNDRFFLNVLDHCSGTIDLSRLAIMNRCFAAGADKGIAYDLLNDFVQTHDVPGFPKRVDFEVCFSRDELIQTVFDWRSWGLQPVIKPHGTGLGHGIEFFLKNESDASVIQKVTRSMKLTEEYYAVPGGAFPYTVCQYVDADRVNRPGHRLHDHKYEIRVVVYRDETLLRAYPSIVKVACEPCHLAQNSPTGLINNITASCVRTRAKGTDFMFPLANRETLDLFGLKERDIAAACRAATGYVRFVLDQVEDSPERLGLPSSNAERGVTVAV